MMLCAVVDELHAQKTRDVWDAINTPTGARSSLLIYVAYRKPKTDQPKPTHSIARARRGQVTFAYAMSFALFFGLCVIVALAWIAWRTR